MTTFKLGDFVHVNGYGNGHVVLVDLSVDTFRDDEFRGTGVALEDSGETVIFPTSRVHPGIRPYIYALHDTTGYVGRIVDLHAYISLEEAEEAKKKFEEKHGYSVDIVEMQTILPWKKRD